MAGGALWLVLWLHQLAAHGTTEVNETKLVFGLTWMDSGKLYVGPFVLFLVAAAAASTLQQRTALDRAGFVLTGVALVGLMVGTALQFWPFEWGSYAETFEDADRAHGGLVSALASFVMVPGAALFALSLFRAGAIPWWSGVAVTLGAPTTIFLSPAFPFPGLGWAIFGVGLLRRHATRRGQRYSETR